ncbi:MAG: MBL fold metallo-hydrolase [Spirochaetes bacterium]|nr:MBL fold metallo-hydrolase [Spirochaetota bacterium]
MNLVFFGTSSAIPAVGNGYTSFLIALDGYRILIDTGDNPVKALLECGEDPRTLDAVVLTHTHIDHLGAFPSLISALDCMKREKPLKIIASKDTQETAERLLRHFPLDPNSLSFPLEYGDSLAYGQSLATKSGTRFFSDFSLSLLTGKHAVPTSMVQILVPPSPVPPNPTKGLRSQHPVKPVRLLYTSDYHHGTEVTRPSGEVDVLIHEATYPHDRLPSNTSHSSAQQAGIAAQKSGSHLLFLCHFEVAAYPNGIEAAGEEASREFNGKVIVPTLYQWYKIPDSP